MNASSPMVVGLSRKSDYLASIRAIGRSYEFYSDATSKPLVATEQAGHVGWETIEIVIRLGTENNQGEISGNRCDLFLSRSEDNLAGALKRVQIGKDLSVPDFAVAEQKQVFFEVSNQLSDESSSSLTYLDNLTVSIEDKQPAVPRPEKTEKK